MGERSSKGGEFTQHGTWADWRPAIDFSRSGEDLEWTRGLTALGVDSMKKTVGVLLFLLLVDLSSLFFGMS
jgi:hypothetical protein